MVFGALENKKKGKMYGSECRLGVAVAFYKERAGKAS